MPARRNAADESREGILEESESFDGTEFGQLGFGANRGNKPLENEQAEQVSVPDTGDTLRTLVAERGQLGLRLPEFKNQFNVPAQAIHDAELYHAVPRCSHAKC
ncbi:MAG: hypothetical protein ABI947_29630 [Chloroflexota bacterium]